MHRNTRIRNLNDMHTNTNPTWYSYQNLVLPSGHQGHGNATEIGRYLGCGFSSLGYVRIERIENHAKTLLGQNTGRKGNQQS